jgi:SAM-dependent methyltransferase
MTARDPLQLRRTFDSAAERYDRARPPYPTELFEDLAAMVELRAGSRILEIGGGTGLATVPLAERGYMILVVELGAELAAIARRRLAAYPNVEVVVAAFEDWPLPDEPFDAVVSATAFHWIDPEIRVSKATRALRPGGSLAIIETHRTPLGPDAFLADLWRCHQRFDTTGRPHRKPAADDPPDSRAEVDRSGLFDRVESRRYEWTQELSTEDYLELLMTFSSILALEPEQQSSLLRCIAGLIDGQLDGRIGELNVNQLLVARTPNQPREGASVSA